MFRVFYYLSLVVSLATVFSSTQSSASNRVIKGLEASEYPAPKVRPPKPRKETPIPECLKLTERDRQMLSRPSKSEEEYKRECDEWFESFCLQQKKNAGVMYQKEAEQGIKREANHQAEMRRLRKAAARANVEMQNDKRRFENWK